MLTDSRFRDLLSEERRSRSIVIAGLGGIGGQVFYGLFRMGFNNLYGVDKDTVELANCGTQLYSVNDVGQNKSSAMEGLCKSIGIGWPDETVVVCGDLNTTTGCGQFVNISLNSSVVVLAVDCMNLRKKIVEDLVLRYHSSAYGLGPAIIDARMAAEEFQMRSFFVGDPKGVKAWLGAWFPPSEAERGPCTASSTYYTGLIAGGMIMGQIKAIVKTGGIKEYFCGWALSE